LRIAPIMGSGYAASKIGTIFDRPESIAMTYKSTAERCTICSAPLERKGDDWGDLCPCCADAVSNFLDDTGLNDRHVGRIISLVHVLAEQMRALSTPIAARESGSVVFPSRRKAIFVHGCFWHQHRCYRARGRRLPVANRAYWLAKLRRNRERDRAAGRALRRLGWRVIIIWECQARPAEVDRLTARLRRFLDED
jgi:DNA mismatch endonuclease Vsr